MSDKKRGTEDQQQHHPSSNTPRNPTNRDPQGQNPSQSQPSSSSSAPSLASRIQSSAAGLARNAFTSGPASDAQLLASGTNAKAGGASSSSSALSAAQQYRQETSIPSTSSASHNSSSIGSGAAFRSSTEQPHLSERGGFELPPLSADEFQHAPIDDPFTQTITGKGKTPATAAAFHTQQWTQHHEQSEPDGAAVLSLLNSPSFDPEFPETANEPFEPVETELAPPTQLSPAEIEMLDSFRRQLNIPAEPSQQQQPHRLTSFSLVPDIASVLDSAPSSTATDATALRDDVLTRLPGAADWFAVEERYHDEVWGYLRPALEAAAKEMEEKRDDVSGSGLEEGPAVRRLKMILKHMQA